MRFALMCAALCGVALLVCAVGEPVAAKPPVEVTTTSMKVNVADFVVAAPVADFVVAAPAPAQTPLPVVLPPLPDLGYTPPDSYAVAMAPACANGVCELPPTRSQVTNYSHQSTTTMTSHGRQGVARGGPLLRPLRAARGAVGLLANGAERRQARREARQAGRGAGCRSGGCQ